MEAQEGNPKIAYPISWRHSRETIAAFVYGLQEVMYTEKQVADPDLRIPYRLLMFLEDIGNRGRSDSKDMPETFLIGTYDRKQKEDSFTTQASLADLLTGIKAYVLSCADDISNAGRTIIHFPLGISEIDKLIEYNQRLDVELSLSEATLRDFRVDDIQILPPTSDPGSPVL